MFFACAMFGNHKACGRFCIDYDIFDEFDLALTWHCHMYLLESTDRSIGSFLPGNVPAVRYGTHSFQLWPSVSTSKKRVPQPSPLVILMSFMTWM